MSFSRLAAASALLGTLSVPCAALAAQPAAVSLPRTGKWEMKYNPDSCQLVTTFGSGDDKVMAVLSREEPRIDFNLELYGKQFKSSAIAIPVELQFGPAGKSVKRGSTSLMANIPEKTPMIRMGGVRIDGEDQRPKAGPPMDIAPAYEAAITWIDVKLARGRTYRLQTGNLGAPMAAMRACTDDLIKSWGYDPAAERTLRSRAAPVSNPGTWLRSDDFPFKSLAQGHDGMERFRLDVDAAGQPSGCRVLYRTNPDEFADLLCELLMKRARFKPAIDAAGKPAKSFFISTIRWVS